MKLNDNIATDFGSLVTLAFMTFADSEDDSVNFDFMEMELFRSCLNLFIINCKSVG